MGLGLRASKLLIGVFLKRRMDANSEVAMSRFETVVR